MERKPKKKPTLALTAKRLERLQTPGRYRDGGQRGLYLQVASASNRSWIFRFERDGKEFAMGLGSANVISLRAARKKAQEAREKLINGVNPLLKKREDRAAERLRAAQAMTFGEAAEMYYRTMAPGWRNLRHAGQWCQTVLGRKLRGTPTDEDHCRLLRPLPVAAIDTGLVLKVIEPLWLERTETASRIRSRIERVLSWAIARGYRSGPNPALWRGHLDTMLPSPAKIAKPNHHEAMPYDQLPRFIEALVSKEGITAKALLFKILTNARSGEAVRARFSEIDLREKVWTVPGERMKNGQVYRVPLSAPALELLASLPREAGSDIVFLGNDRERPSSTRSLLSLMERMNVTGNVHGLRSTFADWAHERSGAENMIIELCMAHTVGSAVERAYRRTDLMEKRRRLMNQWGEFCMSGEPASGDNIVAMRGRHDQEANARGN
jgi:integrase